MRSSSLALLILTASCPLLAASPQSQTATAPPAQSSPATEAAENRDRKPVFYETTTITARPVASAPAAVTVIDAGEITASEARSATDVLLEAPGLNALSSGGRGSVTNAFLRGSDPNYTLVLLDGIPLNDATELQGGAVNLEELPANLVERVEVVRGPLTSFYGTNALAGVVQLFAPRGGPGPVRFSSGVEAGNADLRRGFARVSGPAGATGGYAAGGSWEEEKQRVGQDRFRQLNLWGTGDLRLADEATLALTGRFADGLADDYPDASGGPLFGTGLLRHTDHQDVALGARLDLGDAGSPRHRVFVGLSRREQDRTSPAVPPAVPESVESTTYTRLRAAWQVPLLRRARTELDAGLSGEGEWGRNESVLELPDFMGGAVPGSYTKDRTTIGAFAGARHERGRLLGEAALRVDRATGGDLQANPHAGLVLRAGGHTRLRVSGGRASKLPSFFALASPRALGGNPALEPEHVWGGEAGIEQRLDAARLDLTATYFRQDYRNLVDFDFEQFLHVNRSRVRTQGVELTARWQPHASVALDGEATYLNVDDLSTGGTLLHTPHWTGGARLTWRPVQGVSLRVQARGSSRYLDVQYPVPDRDTVDGYGLLGVAGSWRLRDGLVLRARADNLTDRVYETLIGFPGPGRSYWAGIGWERP